MKPYLFESSILPVGFSLPAGYLEMMASGAGPDLAPWRFLADDMARSLWHYGAMLLKYPGQPLVPFAEINDTTGHYNDGNTVLACFDGSDASGNPVVRIYDYGTFRITPWQNKSFANFDAWLEDAREESASYRAEMADREAGG